MGNGEMFIDGEKVADIKVESHRRIVEFKIAERDIRRTTDEIVITSIKNANEK